MDTRVGTDLSAQLIARYLCARVLDQTTKRLKERCKDLVDEVVNDVIKDELTGLDVTMTRSQLDDSILISFKVQS